MGESFVTVLNEPKLQFAEGQLADDPHDGLTLFGPYTMHSPGGHPTSPGYVVMGTTSGINLFGNWSKAMNQAHWVKEVARHRLWPPYPGFEVAFGSKWAEKPVWTYPIDRDKILSASRKRDAHERAFAVVDIFLKGFEKIKKLDASIGCVVCVIPDEVQKNCRPLSTIREPSDLGINTNEKKARQSGQQLLFGDVDLSQYVLAPDFRRQLKARSMAYDIPVQIIQESTLRLTENNRFGLRGLTPLSDRMWNLATAFYYKCGGKPWKLANAREGVCYVGLAFKMAADQRKSGCCAAQMFIDSGDGIVFLSEDKPSYSAENKQFHLSKDAAERLLRGILETYETLEGQPLREIFLHSRSFISLDEYEGYQKACPPGCKFVGIRVRRDKFGQRLYRTGQMPVLRGTFWQTSDRAGLLFGGGFKGRLATYDGWDVPIPLSLSIQHGDAPIETVAKDILGLTKLNYNACRFGESEPVTVKFSDAVGEILVSNPTVRVSRSNFKFYI